MAPALALLDTGTPTLQLPAEIVDAYIQAVVEAVNASDSVALRSVSLPNGAGWCSTTQARAEASQQGLAASSPLLPEMHSWCTAATCLQADPLVVASVNDIQQLD